MFDAISLHLQYKDNVQFHSGTALHVCHYTDTVLYMYAAMHHTALLLLWHFTFN